MPLGPLGEGALTGKLQLSRRARPRVSHLIIPQVQGAVFRCHLAVHEQGEGVGTASILVVRSIAKPVLGNTKEVFPRDWHQRPEHAQLQRHPG